jgi:hypothetical protein
MTARPALRLASEPRSAALGELIARWREAVEVMRRYGDERRAAVVARLAGELETALGAGHASQGRPAPASVAPDRLLTVREAATRLGVAPTWVHRHWRTELRDCARVLGTRTLRFSERALEERCRRLQPGDLT